MVVAIKNAYVYMLTNKKDGVIYTGVTNDLRRRVWEHKNQGGSSFTTKYNIHKLVYFEYFDRMDAAIFREKQIKAGSRKNKMKLIEDHNPEWLDLYDTIE